MPVSKFKSFQDASEALWLSSENPELFSRLKALWSFSAHLVGPAGPRGIQKFHSIEEANQARALWIQNRRPTYGPIKPYP